MQVTGAIRCPTKPSSYVTHLYGVEGNARDRCNTLPHETLVMTYTHLYGVEGNAGHRCNTLPHETLVILDGAERLSGVIENADKLLY